MITKLETTKQIEIKPTIKKSVVSQKPKKSKAKKPKSKMYSNRIKAILTEIGMSQQELADIMETNPAHLSRIINGQRKCISLPIAMKLAQALGRSVEEVFQISKDTKAKV
jgi:DNA-binding XRE family transcriptional regulator